MPEKYLTTEPKREKSPGNSERFLEYSKAKAPSMKY